MGRREDKYQLNISSEQALCYKLYIKYIFYCIVTQSYEVDVIFILKEKNGQKVEGPRKEDTENLRTFLHSSQWKTGSFEHKLVQLQTS